MKRRWTHRVHLANGEDAWLVVYVPPDHGTVYASIGTLSVRYEPDEVEPVREMLQQARAVALLDRGHW